MVDLPEQRTPKVYLKAAMAEALQPSFFIFSSYVGHRALNSLPPPPLPAPSADLRHCVSFCLSSGLRAARVFLISSSLAAFMPSWMPALAPAPMVDVTGTKTVTWIVKDWCYTPNEGAGALFK